ncbi:hypothetical protein DSL72_009495 [Monilinia vaccinii-corymbosi]|uniref:2EXR domain-containing protein n=1 Tax=Monilinia vaccinii-corymbosi TaxID=61207 RepID=A0A8A3PPG6_9HELO|nr:hypothetical protein DSL72_009495 [Monilinia vaccinii-corymbosi]
MSLSFNMASSSPARDSSSSNGSFSTNTASSTNMASSNSIISRPQPGFEKFPQEVQDMIWEATIVQRLVEVRFAPVSNGFRHPTDCSHDYIADFPVILHICQKSREIGLKNYELVFIGGCQVPVYFNFKLDILYPRASCTKKHLEFLTRCMDRNTITKLRFLAMYNEHLERTQSLNTWRALPLEFPHLEKLWILFKSLVDPKKIEVKARPACRDSVFREPLCEETLYDDRKSPAWVRYEREISKEKVRAILRPPHHSCERHRQKGHSRRSHFVEMSDMLKEQNVDTSYVDRKVRDYKRKLKKAGKGIMGINGTRYNWRVPAVEVRGLCEYGLEFEKAPGLAYNGKFYRYWDDEGIQIKKHFVDYRESS